MNRTKIFLILSIIMSLAVIALSCEDDEPSERSNLSGTVTYKGESSQMKGGLLDEKSDSTFYRTTFEFKVSDQPIHQSMRKVFEMYVSSEERISIEFKLTSSLPDKEIKTGTYSYSPEEIDSPDFPDGLILHHAFVYVGTGNSTTNHPVRNGTVVIEGSFPDYTLTFSLITDEGNLTGTVAGEFITRESYNDYFSAN